MAENRSGIPEDIVIYLHRMEQKTQQLEQDANNIGNAIEERNKMLNSVREATRLELSSVQATLRAYQTQMEQHKKNLLFLLKLYKIVARKDEYIKLAQQIEQLGFEKLITRSELSRLMQQHSSRHESPPPLALD